MLKYIFRYIPLYGVLFLLFSLISGMLNVYLSVNLPTQIINAFQYKEGLAEIPQTIAVAAFATVMFYVLQQIFDTVYKKIAIEKINRKMQMELMQKAIGLDVDCYDNPDFYNNFVWAISEAHGRALTVLEVIGSTVNNIAILFFAGAYIVTTDRVGIIIVLICITSNLFFSTLINKTTFNRQSDLKPLDRKSEYITRIFYLPDYAKDIRMSDVKSILMDQYAETTEQMQEIIKKYSQKLFLLQFSQRFIILRFLLSWLYPFILIYKIIILKALSYASFLGLIRATWTLEQSLESIIYTIPRFQENSLYIDKLKSFLNYKTIISGNGVVDIPAKPCVLELKNVSFQYGNRHDLVLKDISMRIEAGEKIALVGHNGAGKTTLVKLLTRLYDPTGGSISYDGRNIKDYNPFEYRHNIGVIFQNYNMYATTLGANVIMDLYKDEDDIIHNALLKAGFDKHLHMKKGFNTVLSKELDREGVLLSGGESQKVAISRVFAKNFPLIILDEPSSALDPISEYQINETIRVAVKNRSVIFISHRLSSTRIADRIYLLEKGEILEQGTHSELINMNGKYAYMYNLQAQKYKIDNR